MRKSKPKILTEDQLKVARYLKSKGYSNRYIANQFNVAKTTIYYNIYNTSRERLGTRPERDIKTYQQLNDLNSLTSLYCVILVVKVLKQEGYNSSQIAEHLNIPLEEINKMYYKY